MPKYADRRCNAGPRQKGWRFTPATTPTRGVTDVKTTLLASAAILTTSAAFAQTEIEVFHAWPSHERFHAPIAEAFMAANPDITITFRTPGPSYDEAHQIMLRAALTNDLPDVYVSGYHLLSQAVGTLEERAQITPLTEFMAAEGTEWIEENYADNVLALGEVDGTLYAMPFNASTPIVFFNADLVRDAGGDPETLPDTWDELLALAADIDALGDNIEGISYDVHDWWDDWLWQALIFQQGGQMMNEAETQVAFGGEVGLNALTLARRIVTDGGMEVVSRDESSQLFCAGAKGIHFTSTASVRSFTDCAEGNFELLTHTYPILNRDQGLLPTGGNAAMITTTDPEVAEAAWRYIRFMGSPEGQAITVLNSGYMPTNLLTSGPDHLGDHYENNPNWVTSLDQLPVARNWYGYPGTNGPEIWRTQEAIIRQVMTGDITPENGIEMLVNETQSLLPES